MSETLCTPYEEQVFGDIDKDPGRFLAARRGRNKAHKQSKSYLQTSMTGSKKGASIQEASAEKATTPNTALPKAEEFKKRHDDRPPPPTKYTVESFTQKDLPLPHK